MKVTIVIFMILWTLEEVDVSNSIFPDQNHYLFEASDPLKAVLRETSTPDTSAIFIADVETLPYTFSIQKELGEAEIPRGTSLFDVIADMNDVNATASVMADVLQEARKMRMKSWTVVIIVLSEDVQFLEMMAEMSLKKRLLGYFTKMLVVTRLFPSTMKPLMAKHWTFSMTNSMFLNLEDDGDSIRWHVYSQLPYSPRGPTEIPLGSWKRGTGFRRYRRSYNLFPDKFQNFYGAVVNVSSLIHEPHWDEEVITLEDGTKKKVGKGSDGFTLRTMAEKLNFSYHVNDVDSWAEVKQQVMNREAFISPVYWDLVPERLEEHDMSYIHEHAYLSFFMAVPAEDVQWTSLYSPLTNNVWLFILISSILASISLHLMLSHDNIKKGRKDEEPGMAVQEVVATLLDQNFTHRLPENASGRTLMVGWLMFSFVVGAAYRANLTAHLMLPSYQARAETVEELVRVVDEITAERYLVSTKQFLKNSDYPAYRRVGELMEPTFMTSDGLQQAVVNKRSAHVDFLKHTQYIIVKKFTLPDGSTKLYNGKSNIVHFPSSFPVPHDAPYLPIFDKIIQAVLEAGLIDFWYFEEIAMTQRESMKKQRAHQAEIEAKMEAEGGGGSTSDSANDTPALTVEHMLGPFILFFLGSFSGIVSFMLEIKRK